MNSSEALAIAAAASGDAGEVALLFAAYREFYGEAEAAPGAVRAFIDALIEGGHTRFFLARASGAVVGFMHLMPSLNTLAMRPVWLLEDLYVYPAARCKGVAAALLTYAENFAMQAGAERITLATAHDNAAAQALYRRYGYVREDHFEYYHRILR